MWDDVGKENQKICEDVEKGNQKKWNDIEKENDRHHKEWDNLSKNEKGQSGGPPPVQNLTSEVQVGASCSCGKVLLSSLGPAANFQPQAMGTYTMAYTSYNNHPSYRQNYGRDFRLYYAPTGWLIGDNRGAPTGYIHNADHSQACPYTIPSGWMFYSAQHGAWYPDTTLVLRCITP